MFHSQFQKYKLSDPKKKISLAMYYCIACDIYNLNTFNKQKGQQYIECKTNS